MNKQKVLIFGNTGFIGNAVSAYLKKKGAKVYGYSYPEFDLMNRKDLERVKTVFDKESIAIMASWITKDREDSLDSFEKNIAMVTSLCKTLKEKPVKKLVFISSIAVYGKGVGKAMTERTPIQPNSYYALSKYCGEQLFCQAAQGLFPVLILRLTGIYGPGDTHLTYGPLRFIHTALAEETITLFGKGEDKRDFLYIDDAARIIGELSLKDSEGVYNLGTGTSYSFQEIAQLLISDLENAKIRYSDRKQGLTHHHLDIAKLKQELPQERFINFQESLRQLVLWKKGEREQQGT